MANMSCADGTGVFTGDWSDEDIRLFLKVNRDRLQEAYYDTTILSTEDEAMSNRSYTFKASGRWSYQNNLECLSDWLIDGMGGKSEKDLIDALAGGSIPPDVLRLARVMAQKGLSVSLSYTDEEGCQEVLYTQEGVIRAKSVEVDGRPVPVSLCYEMGVTKEYEYTRTNLEALDCVGDFDVEVADVLDYVRDNGVDPETLTAEQVEGLRRSLDHNPFCCEPQEIVSEVPEVEAKVRAAKATVPLSGGVADGGGPGRAARAVIGGPAAGLRAGVLPTVQGPGL